jgi:propanol-preferring alcohol dehydrogenase
VWAGGSGEIPPELLDAAIIFAPVGSLVPKALRDVDKAGAVICGGIHMSDIPSFPYELLWEERSIRSVANLTRQDAAGFLNLVSEIPLHTTTHFYPLSAANQALGDLKTGRINGAAVLTME